MFDLKFTLTMNEEQFRDLNLLSSHQIYAPKFIKEFIDDGFKKLNERKALEYNEKR